MSDRYFIVICAQAYCQEGGPARIEYHSDRKRFADQHAAREHGFTLGRSDDFNIGLIEGGELVDLYWMHDTISEDAETLAAIAKEIGL